MTFGNSINFFFSIVIIQLHMIVLYSNTSPTSPGQPNKKQQKLLYITSILTSINLHELMITIPSITKEKCLKPLFLHILPKTKHALKNLQFIIAKLLM